MPKAKRPSRPAPDRRTGETVAHIAGRVLDGGPYTHAEVLAMAASLVNQSRK